MPVSGPVLRGVCKTMNVYGSATMRAKQQANSKVVQMVIRGERRNGHRLCESKWPQQVDSNCGVVWGLIFRLILITA